MASSQSWEEMLCRAVSGVFGGLVATTVMHPVDLVQKRIQVQDRSSVPKSERYSGIVDALLKTASQNGIRGLYDGMLVSYFSNVTKNTTFFMWYESLKWLHSKYAGIPLSASRQMQYGMLSGMVTTFVTLPIQVVQTQKNVHSNRGSAHFGAWDAVKDIWSDKGIWGFYVGLTPSLVLSIYPAIQHMVFDRLRLWYLTTQLKKNNNHAPPEDGELPTYVAFFLGITSNIVALLLTYPLIYLKVRVQAQKVHRERHLGTLEMAKKIISRRGVLGLWQGMQSQILNACISNAILFSTKERVQALAKKMILASTTK